MRPEVISNKVEDGNPEISFVHEPLPKREVFVSLAEGYEEDSRTRHTSATNKLGRIKLGTERRSPVSMYPVSAQS
jgi:hypothetical protein